MVCAENDENDADADVDDDVEEDNCDDADKYDKYTEDFYVAAHAEVDADAKYADYDNDDANPEVEDIHNVDF